MVKNATKNKAEKHVSSMRENVVAAISVFGSATLCCSEFAAALLSGES